MGNILLSLFTPSNAFKMIDEDIYNKYRAEISEGGTMTEAIQDLAEGCWEWLTESENVDKAGRPTPMMMLFTKQDAESTDAIFVEAEKAAEDMLLFPTSDWEEVYSDYVHKLRVMMKKRYAHAIPEDVDAQRVHAGIMRRVDWITMQHPTRTIPPYPLLTRSVLPEIANQLKRFECAISEVSVFLWIAHICADVRALPCLHARGFTGCASLCLYPRWL